MNKESKRKAKTKKLIRGKSKMNIKLEHLINNNF